MLPSSAQDSDVLSSGALGARSLLPPLLQTAAWEDVGLPCGARGDTSTPGQVWASEGLLSAGLGTSLFRL